MSYFFLQCFLILYKTDVTILAMFDLTDANAFNPLPDDEIVGLAKLELCADNKFN